MNLQNILNQKGDKVFSIEASASIADAVQELVRNNCGSLMVKDGEKIVGIITERDVLRTCAEVEKPLSEVPVEARMTREVVTAHPGAPISEAMGLLTRRRIRHLPVFERGTMLGMISIGDVVKAQHASLTMENHYLKEYLMG